MKKRKRIGLGAVIVTASTFNGLASGLVAEQCTLSHEVYYPLIEVGFTFKGAIAVADNSTATIYLDGQPLETGVLSCSNYEGKKRTQGSAVITFESPLLLPKGKTYRLVVPEGVIYREGKPDISNDELSVEFQVPATLGLTDPTIEEGSVVVKADTIGFYFDTETAKVDNGKAILLREGVPVREYDCDVSWDWDLGYAGIDFGEWINFEKGVEFSVMIPAGSVSARRRSDIVNEEQKVSFFGGYTEPLKPLRYSSIYFDCEPGTMGIVKFYYDVLVSLLPDPVIQLYAEAEDLIVREVVPTLVEEDGKWVLVADFGNDELLRENAYSVIIPEGTVVTKKGDVVVNQRNVIAIGNNGVGTVALDETLPVDVYTADGIAVAVNVEASELHNLPAGLYIIRQGEISVKRIMR